MREASERNGEARGNKLNYIFHSFNKLCFKVIILLSVNYIYK